MIRTAADFIGWYYEVPAERRHRLSRIRMRGETWDALVLTDAPPPRGPYCVAADPARVPPWPRLLVGVQVGIDDTLPLGAVGAEFF